MDTPLSKIGRAGCHWPTETNSNALLQQKMASLFSKQCLKAAANLAGSTRCSNRGSNSLAAVLQAMDRQDVSRLA